MGNNLVSSIQGLTLAYPNENNERIVVLDNVDLSLTHDEIVTLIGPNGSGKSSLLNSIAGLHKPDQGSIEFISSKPKPDIGYVWQNYKETLLPWFNVEENIAFPLRLRGVPHYKRKKAATDLLASYGRGIKGTSKVYELSGGQQQLVAILRSLTIEPDMILLDEPFSALDMKARWGIAQQFEQIWLSRKVPVLLVSHDIDEAISVADRIVLLSKKEKGILSILNNENSRPRTSEMRNSAEHLRCRKLIIEFFHNEGVI